MSSQNLNSALVALPALTVPVTTKQATTLMSDMAQLENLNRRQLWAVAIVAKIRTLHYKGGVNYVSNHNLLHSDAAAFMGGFSPIIVSAKDQLSRLTMQAALDWSSAHGNDGTTPTTINGLLVEAAELSDTDETTLEFIYYFLRYAIG
jgi:hypothetical protein